MNGRRSCILGMLVLAAAPAVALAQENTKAGLTVTTPTAIGLIWHLSDRVALRPDFFFGTSDVHGDANIAESSAWNYTLNVSGLFFVRQWEQLRTYVSPRFSYTRASSKLVTTSGPSTIHSTSNIYGFAGSFGADYRLGCRFAVFAETGLSGSRQRSKVRPSSPISDNDRTIDTLSVRSALGIVLYF